MYNMLNDWINETYGELQDRVNPPASCEQQRKEPEPPPQAAQFHPTVPRCYREALSQLPARFTEQHFIMGFGNDVREVATTLCAMKVPYVTRLILLAHWPHRRAEAMGLRAFSPPIPMDWITREPVNPPSYLISALSFHS